MHRSFSMGALNRAVVLAALAAGVDAAKCRGPSTCGCSDNQFCNFDYGGSGGCESCSSFSSAAACGQDGLPSDGEDDCVACCFGSDSNDDGQCLGPSACGCVSGTFCNFDDGDIGACEGCIDDCYGDGLPEAGAADCAACCADGGDGTVAPMAPCLDAHASRLGVSAVPETASDLYRAFFCQYASITAPNGKPIEIFGGDDLSSLQIYRAKSILAFYLEDVADSLYGADKGAVADAMADNGAKLDMPNGAHEEYGAGTSLEGQELYWAETPVEGDAWFVGCDYDHRDAAFEEILHLVHDNGIGIDRAGYPAGALPGYQAVIRAATDHAQPTSLGGTGLWGEGADDWIEELADEGSLTQEYLASVIDVYYGLWAHYGAGMWGLYGPATRADIETLDPNAWAMVPQFFADHLTWLAYLPDTFEGTFTLSFDEALCYTHKSQYYRHVALLGANDADLVGNDGANCFGVNAGANTVTGGGGDDVVMFRGACADYNITCDGGCVVVDSAADRDGTTTTDAEVLSFDDGDYDGGCGAPRSDAAAACWALVPEASSAPDDDDDSWCKISSFWCRDDDDDDDGNWLGEDDDDCYWFSCDSAAGHRVGLCLVFAAFFVIIATADVL